MVSKYSILVNHRRSKSWPIEIGHFKVEIFSKSDSEYAVYRLDGCAAWRITANFLAQLSRQFLLSFCQIHLHKSRGEHFLWNKNWDLGWFWASWKKFGYSCLLMDPTKFCPFFTTLWNWDCDEFMDWHSIVDCFLTKLCSGFHPHKNWVNYWCCGNAYHT